MNKLSPFMDMIGNVGHDIFLKGCKKMSTSHIKMEIGNE